MSKRSSVRRESTLTLGINTCDQLIKDIKLSAFRSQKDVSPKKYVKIFHKISDRELWKQNMIKSIKQIQNQMNHSQNLKKFRKYQKPKIIGKKQESKSFYQKQKLGLIMNGIRRRSCEGEIFGQFGIKMQNLARNVPLSIIQNHLHQKQSKTAPKRQTRQKLQRRSTIKIESPVQIINLQSFNQSGKFQYTKFGKIQLLNEQKIQEFLKRKSQGSIKQGSKDDFDIKLNSTVNVSQAKLSRKFSILKESQKEIKLNEKDLSSVSDSKESPSQRSIQLVKSSNNLKQQQKEAARKQQEREKKEQQKQRTIKSIVQKNRLQFNKTIEQYLKIQTQDEILSQNRSQKNIRIYTSPTSQPLIKSLCSSEKQIKTCKNQQKMFRVNGKALVQIYRPQQTCVTVQLAKNNDISKIIDRPKTTMQESRQKMRMIYSSHISKVQSAKLGRTVQRASPSQGSYKL